MRVNKKGLLAAGAVAVAASLALAGCSGAGSSKSGSSDAASSTLTVWVDADRAAVLKDAAAAFTKESGVTVKLVQVPDGGYQRCARVTYEAVYTVPAIRIPIIGGYGDGFLVRSRHSEIIDGLRSELPGEAVDCGLR